ncbi:hypothetical protein HanIR_Chr03g0128181 [Helianthus annuus]|nr:hypothetical protein HanIR_Chr03g0128181 [Helianthus annuus]
MDREDKPVYTEDGKVVSLYIVAYKREGGKMGTIRKKHDEELWYHRIVKNFVLPQDADLSAQPAGGGGELSNLGIGPEKKKCATTSNVAPKKSDAEKTQSSKVKNVGGEKKGMRRSSDSWYDYLLLGGQNLNREILLISLHATPDDPIDLESSPEHLVRQKAGKRKQAGAEAEGQPARKVQRKKISRKGILVSPVPTELPPVVNEELPPSPPRASIADQLKTTEVPEGGVEKTVDAYKLVDVAVEAEKVVEPEVMDGSGDPQASEFVAHELGKERTAKEIPVTTSPPKVSGSMPENIEKVSAENQSSFSGVGNDSPIRPEETLGDYYYRTYSEKDASEIHAPAWNLKKGDTFSDCRICHEWFQGAFPPGEIKFQESRSYEQTYHAYLEEAASHVSTTHRIVREWHSMHKDWAAFKISQKKFAEEETRIARLKAKLEADQAKFEAGRKTEVWSVVGWKRKAEAEAALLSEERKNWKKICEKDNAEQAKLRNVVNNLKPELEKLKKQDAEVEKLKKEKADAEAALVEACSHRERSEQREVQVCATLALGDKELEELTALLSDQEKLKKDLELAHSERAETSLRLTETKEKLENSETARVTVESELEPLKSDMAWLKDRGIACVVELVLNSEELDKTVARLVIAARNDGYTQGYTEQHVNSALKVDWDTSMSATYGVNTSAELTTLKTEFNNLQLPVMDLINVALQSDDHVAQLKEIFPDEGEDLA